MAGAGPPQPPPRGESLAAAGLFAASKSFFQSKTPAASQSGNSGSGYPELPLRQVAAVAPIVGRKAVSMARENPEATKAVARVGVAALRAQLEAEAQKQPPKAPKARLPTERPRPQPAQRSSHLFAQPTATPSKTVPTPTDWTSVPSSHNSAGVAALTSQLESQLNFAGPANPQRHSQPAQADPFGDPWAQQTPAKSPTTAPPRPPPPKKVSTVAASATAPSSHQISGPRAEALYEYFTGEVGDLSFRPGQIIGLCKRLNEEWLEGHLEGRQGIFPAAYVRIIEDLPSASSPSRQAPTPPASFQPDPNADRRKVLADFPASQAGDLALQVGDEVIWEERISEEWARGRSCDGRREGIFPAAFVTQVAVAEFDYHSSEPGDLYFDKWDRLEVEEDRGEWLLGKPVASRLPSGIFPKSFVRIL